MNKRILVTGAQGFIGTWLLFSLNRSGHTVYGLDNRYSPGERLYDVIGGDSFLAESYTADLTDYPAIERIVHAGKFDLILNLGANAIVPRAFREPHLTFMSNTVGTLNVLEAVRTSGYPTAVFCVTTDKVYENHNSGEPFTETDLLGGKDIYSVSKSSAEYIARAYALTHNPGSVVHTLRLGNVVGGGDWSLNRLIPDLINSYREGREFAVRYPEATRPFQHVIDVVKSIEALYQKVLAGEVNHYDVWNLGPRDNTYDYVSNVLETFNREIGTLKVVDDVNRVKEDIYLSVDVTKVSTHVAPPKFTSAESITLAFDWYKKYMNSNNPDPVALMDEQLELWKNK
jgi:CDP-glucose 4,6-dehydratase